MVNLKYPSALKGKANMAWLGAIVCGFCPMIFFHFGGLWQEFQFGDNKRSQTDDSPFFHNLVASDFNNSVAGREFLNYNPTFEYGVIDRKRLMIDSYESFSQRF